MPRTPTQQQQQLQPGQLFRIPGIGARPRRVEEVGPCAIGTSIALGQGVSTNAPFGKFQTLDIDACFLFQNTYTTTFTATTITPSPLWPANMISLLQVQFESAYSTYRLPGWLGMVFQMFRSAFGPANRVSNYFQAGSNPAPGAGSSFNGAGWETASPLGTPGLTIAATGVPQTYNVFIEVPVSMYFDLYYELTATGAPAGVPIPRCIVSPQRMAATTRNVIPKVTYAPLTGATDLYDYPTNISGGADTAVGASVVSWFREGWIPTDNMATEPPGRMWQYTRDYIVNQPNQATQQLIPLDDDVPGQGQILALVFGTWDPNLSGGNGAFTPFSSIQTVELRYGSSVQIFQDTPQSNVYNWGVRHGSILPLGLLGWDLALTTDGKLTNENALNTLVMAGCQLVINYNPASKPGAGASTYVGLEVLKKVGS